jgi:hypothetical protein
MSDTATATAPAPETSDAAPAAAPTPAPSGGDWRQSLPPELREAKSLSKFSDVASLAKSYVEMDKMRASVSSATQPPPGLPMPNEQWTDAEWRQLFTKLGAPEKPDGYEFTKPELPEGATYDESLDQFFRDKAHEIGLTKRQAHALRAAWIADQTQRFQAQQQEAQKQAAARQAQLEKVLATFGPDKDAMLDGARRVVDQFGGDAFKQYLRSTGLGDDPVLVEFMAKVGKAMAEDRVILGGASGLSGSFRGSPSAALAEIGRLKADKEFTKSLLDASHPNHKEAKARWKGLHEVAYPSGGA